MTKDEFDFDAWFDTLKINVLDRCGVNFTDAVAAREDYKAGRDVYDVIDEVVAEYGED